MIMSIFGRKKKRIYMDYAATTPVDAEVLKAMMPYFVENFGNASSIHKEGVVAKDALNKTRGSIADILNARSEEIIFTSGGTEANNLTIFGVIGEPKGVHAVTSTIEHPSVLEAFRVLEKKGLKVTYIEVDENGVVNPKDVRDAIKENTILVSIMYVNNEIGTIQPISEIAKAVRHKRKKNIQLPAANFQLPYFHTDASQAPLYLSLNTIKLGVDMMTLGGHKMYGPKGIGCLYVKKDTNLNLERKGTENIPLIIGFAKALLLANANRESESSRLKELQNYFIEKLEKEIPKAELNGSGGKRLPNNVNIYIPSINGEFFVVILDNKAVACSKGSACREGNEYEGSYVIEALGHSKERSTNSLRFSLGKDTTKGDIDYVVKILSESIKKYSI